MGMARQLGCFFPNVAELCRKFNESRLLEVVKDITDCMDLAVLKLSCSVQPYIRRNEVQGFVLLIYYQVILYRK